jgi:FkbM family methyltransferase
VQKLLLRRLAVLLLLALAACEREPEPQRIDLLGTQKKLYSQFDEELVIRDFFQDRRGGFFLDVGAADPTINNTTFYLEKHLDWTGFAVDAVLDYGILWQMQRPRSRFFNYLITDHAGSPETFYHAGVRTLSSTMKDRKWGEQTLGAVEVQVPTMTLTKLLDENGIARIDFLSMDIEESEPAALKGFDIERFRPELVCIEAVERIQPEIQAYFDAHGYERIDRYLERDPVNWYFTPAEH